MPLGRLCALLLASASCAGAPPPGGCETDADCGPCLECRAGACAALESPGAGADGGACTTDTWASYACGFFATQCAGCHGWAAAPESVRRWQSRVIGTLERRAMPPNHRLADGEIERITRWLQCGQPL